MTKNEKYIVDMYVRYFGRAADAAKIATYAEDKKTSVILKNIIADADAEKAELSTSDFVNNAFQNLFGRNATTKEMNKYSKVVDAGKDLPIQSIVKSATKTDKAVYDNKIAVAAKYAELGGKGDLDLSKISKGNTVDLNKVVTLTDLTNAIANLADNSGIPSSFDGKTFVLTEGVDTGKDFIGTNKNDLFVADNSVTGKVNGSAADTLDGGKGTDDTFELYDNKTGGTTGTASTTQSLPTLKNIEKVVIYDNANLGLAGPTTVDLTKWDSVETLFLVRSTYAGTYTLGEKVTTVNIEDKAVNTTLAFDADLTAATLGVNDVVTGANTVKVDGTALKTLTVNAYGKESDVTLTQAAIETLNITGRADLTLNAGSTLTKVKTVDGSKAEGDLTLSKLATMTSVKTGSGNDTVTVVAAASGETINLGAGNDKLVSGGSVAAGSIIDGGAGTDSLDSTLVTVGNAGVFANFETISLTTVTGTPLDLDLLTKSTITSIAKDKDAAHTLVNVKKSQSLTINTDASTAASITTLTFKASEVAGTADAYTINFDKETTGITDANVVTIAGIETVTVNSLGKTSAATDTNKITLKDADAKSLVITGDKNIELVLGTAANEFGTAGASGDGKGVATIDASASTAGIKITTLANIGIAEKGLTIKGGAGDDNIVTGATAAKALTIETGAGDDDIILTNATTPTEKIIVNAGAGDDDITVGATGGKFTLGAGNDKIDVSAATAATTTVATGAIRTTITDIAKGDKIVFGAGGSTLFAKATITGANNLDEALNLAAASTTNVTTWFQYAGKTYIVDDNNAATVLNGADIVVELNGLVDLGNSTLNVATGELTIA